MKKFHRHLIASLTTLALAATSVAAAAPALAATSSTAVLSTETSRTADLVASASSGWGYWRSATAPASSWKTDTAAWSTGRAPLGWGRDTGPVNTVLPTVSGSQPLATYFKKTFSVGTELPTSVRLTTWADDGVVVYLNGREIARANIASSAQITPNTYATAAPNSTTARQRLVTVDVPVSALKSGTNVLAAQVASNWRATPNISFDASLKATYSAGDTTTPPTTPTTPDDGSVAGWGTPDWRDEFTYVDATTGKPAVDPTKWNVRDRSTLGLLPDAAVVDKNQVTVDTNGVMHIRADWLDQPVIRTSGAGPKEIWHKTGYLDQRSLRSGDVSRGQQYGRWEIRAKVPTGPNTFGALAAFWLRNSNSGEIDIMEAWGYDDGPLRDQKIDSATTTVHTQTSAAGNEKFFWTHSEHGGPVPVWADFHTFAFELTPTYAAIIVDGKELARTTPAKNPTLWNKDYFGSPLHMRLNLHVGPSELYWGLPDPNNRAATQNLDFQVDYVRTWSYDG
ncbi:family 16 glycosylhydrolase [Microbacterium sp. NPDC056569]|uniref:family 16 glycosylhydrolase n=1 Tax=Microbacterium sp. NPDC056569 TaxID=3345867 RepID=UPI00366B30EF